MLAGTSGDHLLRPPCSKQDQLQQITLNGVQWGFEYQQGWRLHNLTAQPVSVFDHSHSKKNLPCVLSLHPLPVILSQGTTEGILDPSFYFPHEVFAWIRPS